MRGKYSPTVNAAYQKDQCWFNKYSNDTEGSYYDPEGYDSYGYNEAGYDRAGNSEYEYYHSDGDAFESEDDYNLKYDSTLCEWGFDGTKPVRN